MAIYLTATPHTYKTSAAALIVLCSDFQTLTADTDYIVKFTYPSGWVVKREVTSNSYDATITIDNNAFWNMGTGPVLVEISEATNRIWCCQFVETITAALLLNFINITTEETYATIPVNCP